MFLKSLNQIELEVYNEQQDTLYIHGTTAIEGNTLTLNETYYLLTEGIVPKKSLREINEIQNYKKVRFFINDYKGKLTIPFIKKLHSLIMNNIDYETAGQFRTKDNIIILGSNISSGLAATIKLYLQDLIDSNDLHPFERAILFHYKFEVIHPFTDGNGRTGREILNFMLQKEGYPRFIISKESREMYLKALEHGNKNEVIEMLQIFFELYLESSRLE